MIDVTGTLTEITTHICRNVDTFSHIDPDGLLVCYAQAKKKSLHGMYAKIHPTCFRGGKRRIEHRGREFAYPIIEIDGRRILYVLYFYYPRFQNLRFETKLLTIFHELYHIGPKFDGDIRRFPGKYYAHGKSQKDYDDSLKVKIDAYLKRFGEEEILQFLKMDFKDLQKKYGRVIGTTMKMPKAFAVV
ncbi:MAG: hypothetical protein JW941_06645 [Candidatus Coatesbacteria bacterium]|nr:hypothetical protein [Candidatus Coatesbacteria bacterium]